MANRIVPLLNTADDDIIKNLAASYALIEADGFDRGPATTKRLEEMLKGLGEANSKVYRRIGDALPVELGKVAGQEPFGPRSSAMDVEAAARRIRPAPAEVAAEVVQRHHEALRDRLPIATVLEAFVLGTYLRIVARNLRQKLEEDAAPPRLIINEPGVGYRLIGTQVR